MSTFTEHYSLLLIAFIGFYLVAALCYSTLYSSVELCGFPLLKVSNLSNMIFFFMTLLISVCYFWVDQQSYFAQGSFTWNFYCCFFSIILFLSTISFVYVSKEFIAEKKQVNYEYALIVMFLLLGLILVNSCNDFITFYLAIELYSLSSYVLATLNKNSEFSAEAGIKYFILGAFTSGLLLCSFAFFYVSSGSIDLESIERLNCIQSDAITCFASVLLIASLLFKLGAFPFHMWLCDVYEGSSIDVMALFSTLPKIIILAFLIRFSFTIFSDIPASISFLLAFSGLGSIIFASVAALYQKRIKRLLAYSTISHTGFLTLGVYCATIDSIKASTIYIIIYVLMNLGLFGLLFLSGMKNTQQKYIINWTSFFDRNIPAALVLAITLFSMAGIPPLAGFYSKLCILTCLLSESNILIAVIIAFFSSIACFYYIRLIKVLCFTTEYKKAIWFGAGTKNIELFISFIFTIITLFMVQPNILINFSILSAISLF